MSLTKFFALSLLLAAGLSACQSPAASPAADPTAASPATVETEPVQNDPTETPPIADASVPQPPLPSAVPTMPPPPSATAVATSGPPTATPIPPNGQPAASFSLAFVAGGFFKPLGIEHAGDERLFVIQQPGVIDIVSGGQVLPTPFLDIVDRVNSNANEQGLLGLAFHPNYTANGRFFVNYTAADNSTIIAEYSVSGIDPNRADPASERVLLNVSQPFLNHNGGQIRFGPDGYLYIGMGDGGSADDPLNAGQDGRQLLGSMLRIDVDQGEPYAIPSSNPFVGTDSVRPEIWAKGLRNPWRFTFDRQTGDLYIADVGQNLYEEINFQPAGSTGGENYGWRLFEGLHCYIGNCDRRGLIEPIAEYSHAAGHCSVTGGYVYRGSAYPDWRGNYFMADYCSGAMWSLFPNGDGTWRQTQIGSTGFLVSSFGEGVNGELYVVSQNEGVIYRLTP